MKAPVGRAVSISIAIGAVGAAVVGGLVMLPAPSEERAQRLDERRVNDLRGISRAMDLYWTRRGHLPTSTADLSREPGLRVSARDPGTGQDYELHVLETATYELCASFERSSADSGKPAGLTKDVSEEFWSHGTGRNCFRLNTRELPWTRQRRQP